MKKTIFATGAMAAAAAVCYPREATEISKYSWTIASDFAAATYHDLFSGKLFLMIYIDLSQSGLFSDVLSFE